MKKPTAFFLAMAVSALGVSAAQTDPGSCSAPLVAISSEGDVLSGEKAALIDAVNAGRTIRVGFGLGQGDTDGYFLTHWFEARFITVLGDDVFTQTPFIHRQRPDADASDIFLTDESQKWVATMGTNGILHSRFLDDSKVATHKVDSWWCAS
ncbi:hypothetical protein PUV54_05725 [Hyphococcus flavus]|uniref:Uncharacterized protein n=1 Tax=Hyphococcus flavus TaxID=1866326 RepID=A0AAE9ZD36_9PROT|nr:hypothetical protein [Hyphococcus flavus]WDI32694.1 hypothetical protein PUV54_05725 [Hyphococcus flavus]